MRRVPANLRGEAPLVLRRWRELLDPLIRYRSDPADFKAGLGRIDWMTKRWMMDNLGEHAQWPQRKKIDLRYHELSEDGYYNQFIESHPELLLVDREMIQRRRRSPPAGSPAAKRGWMIREFADSDEAMQAEWTHAMIGRGRRRRRVNFGEPTRS